MALPSLAPTGPRQSSSALGKYQLIASLGQGGMARVYLALVAGPAGVNKLMVVKVVNSETLHGLEGGLELFWDEARLSTRLLHQNIVHTYEVGEVDGHYFLAMEYLDGQIYRVVQSRTAEHRLPVTEELRILSEVARGLHYAHDLKDFRGLPLGVVHRDVSPQNVFVTYDGQVKLIDFGIAKTHDAGHETRVGLIKGKLNYIAPEQLRADPVDRRADVFALGVMLWEALAGRRLAAHNTEVAKVHARISGEEPKIRDLKPDVPEALALIVDKAMALDPTQRFSDAAGFADAIEAYIESTGEHPSAKALAARMHTLFEKDHTALRQVIDARVQAILERTSDDVLQDIPSLLVPEELHTGSGSLLVSGSRPARNSDSQPAEVTGIRHAWAALGQPLRRKLGLLAGGVAVLAVAGAVALLLPGNALVKSTVATTASAPVVQGSVAATPQAAAAAPQAAAAPSSAHVTLSLVVSPADANVAIDGAPVSAPFTGEFPKGTALHRVEVSAPGYRPFARLLAFNQDHQVSITLERERAAGEHTSDRRAASPRARSGAERHATSGATPDGQEPRQASGEEPRRPVALAPGADIPMGNAPAGRGDIDTLNPYANGH